MGVALCDARSGLVVIGLHAIAVVAAVAALIAPRVVGSLVDTVTNRGSLETVDRLAVVLAPGRSWPRRCPPGSRGAPRSQTEGDH